MTGSFYVKSLVLVTKGNEEIEPNDVGVVTRIEVEHVEVFFVGKQKKVKLEADGLHIINPSETGDSYDSKVCNKCHKLL